MSLTQPGINTVELQVADHARGSGANYRFDSLVNPYAPSIEVQRWAAGAGDWHNSQQGAREYLISRITRRYHASEESCLLAPGIQSLLSGVAAWSSDADLVIVQSPSDPLGSLIGMQFLVDLCRKHKIVVVDEQHGERAIWSALPLVQEFDNLLVLRSFEWWAGLTQWPFAVAIGDPHAVEQLKLYMGNALLPESTVHAVHATLDDQVYLSATLDRLRAEKHRLYRTLRKSNVLVPVPSSASFIAVRVVRGSRSDLVAHLQSNRLEVAVPIEQGYADVIRLSPISPVATELMQRSICAYSKQLSERQADFSVTR